LQFKRNPYYQYFCGYSNYTPVATKTPLLRFLYLKINTHNLNFCYGEFLNGSSTLTKKEHGAWWQVDLGSEKKINTIIIYNRTDCCADRLSNYLFRSVINQCFVWFLRAD
jgi:hypothetical protein